MLRQTAKKKNLLERVLPSIYEEDIISLQYADDALIFLNNDINIARNLN
jgi:hypothetical protein